VLVAWALTRGRATVLRVSSTRGPGTVPPGRDGPVPPGDGGPVPPGAGRVIEGEIEPPREP